MSQTLVAPGSALARSVDGDVADATPLARYFAATYAAARCSCKRLRARANEIIELGAALEDISDVELKFRARESGARARRANRDAQTLAPVFALVREAARRALGTPHYDVQLMGELVLHEGLLAEMDTGEGKTLTVTLAAAAAALSGAPVHAATANDYLAARDAESMAPLYRALGLTVGAATAERDTIARRGAYAADVCYSSANQLVFDHLRDRLSTRGTSGDLANRVLRDSSNVPLLRGLGWAIVDEADAVLVDQACTPLRLSRSSESRAERELLVQALVVAGWLAEGEDFERDPRSRQLRLLPAGREHVAERTQPMGGLWTGERRREELVVQALTAAHLLERDRHYIVRDEKIELIDENTGRPMPDRRLAEGLHEMVEVKEECALSGRTETLASTSFQRFFRRYPRLCGLTGTAREVRRELASVYRLGVVRLPPRRPVARQVHPVRVFPSSADRWQAVAAAASLASLAGRPVLIGTRSVGDSEDLSARLQDLGVEHAVLNARAHRDEAAVVARAGHPGAVTVATNMAGRGTDIALGDGVRDLGGLLVIAAEPNESARIDRQLAGRSGRQGDPGEVIPFVSLDDETIVRWMPGWMRAAALLLHRSSAHTAGSALARVLARGGQRRAEAAAAVRRRAVLDEERRVDELLAFSGAPD